MAALARRLEQAGAALSPLARLGGEVLESAARMGGVAEGFVTYDEDGFSVAVLSGPGA